MRPTIRRSRAQRRDRFNFDVDILLMQMFGMRALPDEMAIRIVSRADRQMAFVAGVHKRRRQLLRTPN